jgi:hypothetical protein
MEALPSATPPPQAGTWEEPQIWVVLDLRQPPTSTPTPAEVRGDGR